MAMSDRVRDLVRTAAFIGVVGGLVAMGWLGREAGRPAVTGEFAPALRLPLLGGDTVDLAELRGQVVLVNVWATWCPPCVMELPSMQRVYERYADQGLTIVAVAVDSFPGVVRPDGRVDGVVSQFADRLGLDFPIALDPTGGTEALLGVGYLPTTFLVDRGGRIRVREVGGRHWDRSPYMEKIEALLGEDRG
jgi:thiol-disulfide isomerase/thioredoxin